MLDSDMCQTKCFQPKKQIVKKKSPEYLTLASKI